MLDDDFLVLLNRWEPLDFTIPHTGPEQTPSSRPLTVWQRSDARSLVVLQAQATPRGGCGYGHSLSRRRTAMSTAPRTVLAINPKVISPKSICVVVTIRASSLRGAMSPNPTVAKTVTVK